MKRLSSILLAVLSAAILISACGDTEISYDYPRTGTKTIEAEEEILKADISESSSQSYTDYLGTDGLEGSDESIGSIAEKNSGEAKDGAETESIEMIGSAEEAEPEDSNGTESFKETNDQVTDLKDLEVDGPEAGTGIDEDADESSAADASVKEEDAIRPSEQDNKKESCETAESIVNIFKTIPTLSAPNVPYKWFKFSK